MRLFSCCQLMEDFAWQASWGMGGAYEISEFRQILQTTHVGCYLQPLKMALLDDICRFLNFQRHRGDVAGFADTWPRRRQMRQLPVKQRPVAGDPIQANIILFKIRLPA